MLTLLMNQNESMFPLVDKVSPPGDVDVLNVKDTQSGQNIPVLGFESMDQHYVQMLAKTYKQLEMRQLTDSPISGGQTKAIWSKYYSEIVIRLGFADSTAVADLQLIYYDKNNNVMLSEVMSFNSTELLNDFMFVSTDFKTKPTYGAEYVSVLVNSVSVGNVHIYADCV